MAGCLLALLISLVAFPARAQPSISAVSGSVADGHLIALTGTQFGTAGPDVILFDDFENGTDGDRLNTNQNGGSTANVGEWYREYGPCAYSNEAASSGSLALYTDNTVAGYNFAEVLLPQVKDFYASWWQFVPVDSDYPGYTNNWKTVWVQGTGSSGGNHTGTDDILLGHWLETTNGKWRIHSNDGPPLLAINFTGHQAVKGEWQYFSFYVKGALDETGIMEVWQTGTGPLTRVLYKEEPTLEQADSTRDRAKWNGWCSIDGSRALFDDIYVATGPHCRARIEFCDQPVYTDCTRLSLVTTTSWSSSSLTGVFRAGEFGAGEEVHFFVTDSSGSTSSGYGPVTVEASGPAGPPGAPGMPAVADR